MSGEFNLNPLVINLFGGPGSGKSTTAAGLFFKLKTAGVNCELVGEYAKDKTWEGASLDNQIYVFGKQYHRQWRLLEGVDVIITDSPLLFSLYYGEYDNVELERAFHELVLQSFNQFNNLSFFVKRVKAFNSAGRSQTLYEAKVIDFDLRQILEDYSLPYNVVNGDADGLEKLYGIVMGAINV
jgi:hypothetical protein